MIKEESTITLELLEKEYSVYKFDQNFIADENILSDSFYSIIGIVSKISTVLANHNISIFVISTYNTDYILVKNYNVKKAIDVLRKNMYEILKENTGGSING